MRKYVFALAMTLVPGLAFAQQPQRGPGQGMGMGDGIASAMLAQRAALQLSDDQVAKLEVIQKQQQEQIAALRAEVAQQWPQLTPEERAARRAEMQGQRANRAQMTPEQRAEMRAEMRQQRAQVSPEERAAMRTRMDAFHEQMRPSADAARAVLTAEQQAKWQELMQAGRWQRMGDSPRRGDRPMRGRRGMQTPPALR